MNPKHQAASRTYFVLLVTALGWVFLIPMSANAQIKRTEQHRQLMERKLESTSKVLEGISRSDFDLMARQSQKLHLLSMEAGWNVLMTPTYQRLSEDFRATLDQLEEAAKKENLDAAGLAFVKLSISCIDCHRYARQEMPRLGQRIEPPGQSAQPSEEESLQR